MASSKGDTIVAISTPHGRGGIGVIRLSGPDSLPVALKLFVNRQDQKKDRAPIRSHKSYFGEIIDPKTNERLDEAVFVYLKGPRSYTCEDMVELTLHGNPIIMEEVLKLFTRLGARLAQPGEFTKRAFINKRIDLVQAEAVSELIASKSLLESKYAMKRISGELSGLIEGIRRDLLDIMGRLEAEIDFPEDGLEIDDIAVRQKRLAQIEDALGNALKGYENGRIISSGINTAIVGLTNTGKSTLFNALLKRKRAIVSDSPGTTRDYISDEIELGGILFRLFDTAGINHSFKNGIEKQGIEKTFEIIDRADLLLIVLEKGREISKDERDIIERANGKEKIVVFNKMDLDTFAKGKFRGRCVEISALKGINIDILEKTMLERFRDKIGDCREAFAVSNLRQKTEIENALHNIQKAKHGLSKNESPEFIAFDLRQAYECLGRFAGLDTSSITDDILNEIFNNFCIGK